MVRDLGYEASSTSVPVYLVSQLIEINLWSPRQASGGPGGLPAVLEKKYIFLCRRSRPLPLASQFHGAR